MAWFSRVKSGAEASSEGEKRIRTEGLWLKCDGCSQIIWKKTLEERELLRVGFIQDTDFPFDIFASHFFGSSYTLRLLSHWCPFCLYNERVVADDRCAALHAS